MSRTTAIIVAAGSGERLPGAAPKQLMPVAGAPMLVWSARALSAVCDAVVVVAPPGREDDIRAALADVERIGDVVAGGATRQESVWNGLSALPEGAERVLIHDAARPCVSRALLSRLMTALNAHRAVVPSVGAVDTLIHERDQRVDAILDRVGVCAVQTPQAFEVELIRHAHRAARKRGFQSSDDGSLVLALGEPVATVSGERTNIKVTYPEDVALAEAILRGGNIS